MLAGAALGAEIGSETPGGAPLALGAALAAADELGAENALGAAESGVPRGAGSA